MGRKRKQTNTESTIEQPELPSEDSPSYATSVDVGEEKNSDVLTKLKTIANSNQAALLAFVAPSFGKRTSPIDFQTASIGFYEELGIEEAVQKIKKSLTTPKKKLFLLIESRGGGVDSSYKIARYLRYSFDEIVTFVPHMAASGGTLITLTGNKVVMGEMANLTPIDVQVPYMGIRVSVNRMSSAITRLENYFKTNLPEEVPYPYRAMAEKIDPIIFDDWNIKTNGMVEYTLDILLKAGYDIPSIVSIIENLIHTNHPHSFVIPKDVAASYKIKVVKDDEYRPELNCMKWWLNKYLLNTGSQHYIRYVLPDAPVSGVQQEARKEKTQEEKQEGKQQ